jgi:hypothetical protein
MTGTSNRKASRHSLFTLVHAVGKSKLFNGELIAELRERLFLNTFDFGQVIYALEVPVFLSIGDNCFRFGFADPFDRGESGLMRY